MLGSLCIHENQIESFRDDWINSTSLHSLNIKETNFSCCCCSFASACARWRMEQRFAFKSRGSMQSKRLTRILNQSFFSFDMSCLSGGNFLFSVDGTRLGPTAEGWRWLQTTTERAWVGVCSTLHHVYVCIIHRHNILSHIVLTSVCVWVSLLFGHLW
jgi:hypothetical protein